MTSKISKLAFEDIFNALNWETLETNIDGSYLSHLRFADDAVLFRSDLSILKIMLEQFNI